MNEIELFVLGEIAMLDQLEAHLLVMHNETRFQRQQAAIMRRVRCVQAHRNMLMNWQNRQQNGLPKGGNV